MRETLINELARHSSVRGLACVTGQQPEMLEQMLKCFNIRPDYDLKAIKPGQNLVDITTQVLRGLDELELPQQPKPNWILVRSDTSTTFLIP